MESVGLLSPRPVPGLLHLPEQPLRLLCQSRLYKDKPDQGMPLLKTCYGSPLSLIKSTPLGRHPRLLLSWLLSLPLPTPSSPLPPLPLSLAPLKLPFQTCQGLCMHCSLCLECLFHTFSPWHTLFQLGWVHLQEATPGSRPCFCSSTLCREFSCVPVCLPTRLGCPQGQARPEAPTQGVLILSLKP